MLKVDTILAIFHFLLKLLNAAAEAHEGKASDHDAEIKKLEAAKTFAQAEAVRARKVIDNITTLIS